MFWAGADAAATLGASFLIVSFLTTAGDAGSGASASAIAILLCGAGAGTNTGLSSTFADAAIVGVAGGVAA